MTSARKRAPARVRHGRRGRAAAVPDTALAGRRPPWWPRAGARRAPTDPVRHDRPAL